MYFCPKSNLDRESRLSISETNPTIRGFHAYFGRRILKFQIALLGRNKN
jgi:hypothetical protein